MGCCGGLLGGHHTSDCEDGPRWVPVGKGWFGRFAGITEMYPDPEGEADREATEHFEASR